MLTSVAVFFAGALLAGAASFWALRAYRRAEGGASSPARALAACLAVALVGLGVYVLIGRPDLSDAPYQQRLDALIEAMKSDPPPMIGPEEQLAVLAYYAEQNPGDVEPHLIAGNILLRMNRAREAARSFDQALRRSPQSGEALLGMGRALVAAEGRITPEALAFFQQAGEHDVGPAPWMYQALAATEAGRDPKPLWREALSRMAANDPRREMVRQQLAQ